MAEKNQRALLIDNGRGKDVGETSTRNVEFDENPFYTDEPERMFHRRKNEAKEQAAKDTAELLRRIQEEQTREEQALREAELFQRSANRHQMREEQFAPVNNYQQHAPAYNQQQYVAPARPVHARQQPRQQPSMKDMSIPQLGDQSWCIDTDADYDEFEVKTGVVHYLPKFAGLAGESAVQHLKEYEGVCKTLKPYAAPEDRYKLRVFPFSLTDNAKSWFLSMPSGSIRTWEQMQRRFLDKFYPAAKASKVRRELSVIRQGQNESTYDYVERFNGLEQSCCNLGIPEKLLVEYLLDGLRPLERMMLDAAAGGSVMNLSPWEVRELVRETAESARFRDETTRREDTSRVRTVSQVEVNESSLDGELKEMREMMRMIMVAQANGVKACEFCSAHSHRTDECPSLQIDTVGVNAVGHQQFNNQPQKFGLAANGYSWKQGGIPNQHQNQQPYQHPPQRQNYQAEPSNVNQERPLEDVIRQMSNQMGAYIKQTDNTIRALSKKLDNFMEVTGKQIGQLTTDVTELKAEKGKLPSQTVPNPKSGVNAIMLVSEQGLEDQEAGSNEQKLVESACVIQVESACSPDPSLNFDAYEPPLPFPDALKKTKKSTELDPDLLELFNKVELTIPLIDAIKQVPKYAKFLKELCTKHRGIVKAEQKPLKKHNVAAINPWEINTKHKDRGMFIIPCILGTRWKKDCMLDIGSAINVIPDSIYRTMQIGPLRSTNCMVQLANKSCARPEGIVYDVLVRVEELVFLADFYVLQDDIKENTEDSRIILGRPFMVTARTKTDSWTGEVSVEGNGRKVTLNGYNNLHDPPDNAGKHVNAIDKNMTWDPNAVEKRKAISMQQKKSVQPKRYGLNSIKIHVPTKSCPSKLQVPRYEWRPVQKQLGCKALNKKKKKSPFGKKGLDKEHKLDAPPLKT